jgi:uncharacterized MAPEG superfamily protein
MDATRSSLTSVNIYQTTFQKTIIVIIPYGISDAQDRCIMIQAFAFAIWRLLYPYWYKWGNGVLEGLCLQNVMKKKT